jgi:hypothetical protein
MVNLTIFGFALVSLAMIISLTITSWAIVGFATMNLTLVTINIAKLIIFIFNILVILF